MGSTNSVPRVRNVGLFWDLTSCSFPPNTSEADARACCVLLKKEFVAGKNCKLSYFGVAVDGARVSEARLSETVVTEDVNELMVCQEYEVVGKISASVINWLSGDGISDDRPAIPQKKNPLIVLLSGNENFRALLNRIRFRLKVEVVIVHPGAVITPDLSLLAIRTVPYAVVTIPALEVEKAVDALTQEFRSCGCQIGVETVDPDSEASFSDMETTTPEIKPGMTAIPGTDRLLKPKTGEDLNSSNHLENNESGLSLDGTFLSNSLEQRKDHRAKETDCPVNEWSKLKNNVSEGDLRQSTNPAVEDDWGQSTDHVSRHDVRPRRMPIARPAKLKYPNANARNTTVPKKPWIPNPGGEPGGWKFAQNLPPKHWDASSRGRRKIIGRPGPSPQKHFNKTWTRNTEFQEETHAPENSIPRDKSTQFEEDPFKQTEKNSVEKKQDVAVFLDPGVNPPDKEESSLVKTGIVKRPPLLPIPVVGPASDQTVQNEPENHLAEDEVFYRNPGNRAVPPNPCKEDTFRQSVHNAPAENRPNSEEEESSVVKTGTVKRSPLLPDPVVGPASDEIVLNETDDHPAEGEVFYGNPGNKPVEVKPFAPNPCKEETFCQSVQNVPAKYPRKPRTRTRGANKFEGNVVPPPREFYNKSWRHISPHVGTIPGNLVPDQVSTKPFNALTGNEGLSLKPTGNEPAYKKYDAAMMPQTNPRDLIRLSILPKGFCISMRRAQKEYSVALKYFESLPGTCVEYELPEDELDDFQILNECGAVLRAAKKENVGSSLFVEFGKPKDAEKLKKLRGNSIVISPSEPGIKKKFSWRGVGSVRLLWPLDNPNGRAVVEFPNGESAKYAFDSVSGEEFFVSVWISEMHQNYFPVQVLQSAFDVAKLEVVGFPPLVHSSAILAAFEARDVDMKDVNITMGCKGKNAVDTFVKVKKQLFSYIGKLALKQYSIQFDKPAESEGNGRGTILMAEPLEVLLCVEHMMADLKIPRVLIDCDFTVEIPISKKLYMNAKAFEVLNAIVLEKGQGDVSWLISDNSGVSEFVSLRIGSNLLGKLNRVVKAVGSLFSGVVVNIPENVHQWRENYPTLSLKTHNFDVSSGLIGLMASKLLKNEENDELAQELFAQLEQIAKNSVSHQDDRVCVFCTEGDEKYVQLECGHKYCSRCFLTLAFWSPMLLRCFAKDCKHRFTCTELKQGLLLFSILDPEVGKVFEEKIVRFLNMKVNKNYVLFPCPTFGCTGLIAGEKDPKEIRVICEKCSVEVCLLCRCHFHIAESCELHQLSMNSSKQNIKKWLRDGFGKRGVCRFCSNPVEWRAGPETLPVYCLNCSLVLTDKDVDYTLE
ncbi:unnamed protein product [Notodromas monacha]|uniref:IBR domain-containing protein n=1 Tax=Notodromas monacha TaxID=399045 RepID=A0A7R9BKZ3_9CRUS|nr:unnamed protein product [Notodromas monacha]CAG0916047.1 unnamed protein product [Notodromas monacha]